MEIDFSTYVQKVNSKWRNFGENLSFIGLEHIEKYLLHLNSIGSSKEVQSDKTVFRKGDILFGTLRPYFRKVWKASFNGVCSTDITVLRTKNSDVINQDFLFYFIANQNFINFASSFAQEQRPRANWKDLIKKPFKIPDKKTQEKIAYNLSNYDKLIDNNILTIQLLEEKAEKTFNEWILNFNVYNEIFNLNKLTGLPNGWEKRKIGSLLKKTINKKKINSSEFLDTGRIPIIDQSREFIAGFTDNEEALIDDDLPMIIFGDHTRILKFINFPFARGADGTQILFSKEERMPQHLFYHSLLNVDLSNYHYARHFKFLKELEVIVPDKATANKFEDYAKPIYDLIKNLREQNFLLKEARDILLPRLMTGMIEL